MGLDDLPEIGGRIGHFFGAVDDGIHHDGHEDFPVAIGGDGDAAGVQPGRRPKHHPGEQF